MKGPERYVLLAIVCAIGLLLRAGFVATTCICASPMSPAIVPHDSQIVVRPSMSIARRPEQ